MRIAPHPLKYLALFFCLLSIRSAQIESFHHQEVRRLTALLQSPVAAIRVEGVQGLAGMKHGPSEEKLLPLLSDPNEQVRKETTLALGRLGSALSFEPLVNKLEDTSWEQRKLASLALEEFNPGSTASWGRGQWLDWAKSSSRREKVAQLLAQAQQPGPSRERVLRALRRWVETSDEEAVLKLLEPASNLSITERTLLCEALERIGSSKSIPTLARQHVEAAAWALGTLGGTEAEAALLAARKTPAVMINLDRLASTNCGSFLPHLVYSFGLITYRSHPEDLHFGVAQPVQRAAANLILRSGQAPTLIEGIIRELEQTMQPSVVSNTPLTLPPDVTAMLAQMREELKPGFVRGDGLTTSQPLSALHFIVEDPSIAPRLRPLLKHPAFLPRIYIALTLCKLQDVAGGEEILSLIKEGYKFSDATALASGKHFDQSQTVRWKGFLCMALGKLRTDAARTALEQLASDQDQPRDVRYGAVVGLGFLLHPQSRPLLERVAQTDPIWMVRDEARQIMARLDLTGQRALAIHKEAQ